MHWVAYAVMKGAPLYQAYGERGGAHLFLLGLCPCDMAEQSPQQLTCGCHHVKTCNSMEHSPELTLAPLLGLPVQYVAATITLVSPTCLLPFVGTFVHLDPHLDCQLVLLICTCLQANSAKKKKVS
jgi:hypothetical protein